MSAPADPTLPPSALEAIEARCAAATPGPWKQTRSVTTGVKLWGADGAPLFLSIANLAHSRVTPEAPVPQWQHDCDFVQHARTDIPALVAEVRRLTAEGERLREALDRLAVRIRGADRLADEGEKLLRDGQVGSRSRFGDALLDYVDERDPHPRRRP